MAKYPGITAAKIYEYGLWIGLYRRLLYSRFRFVISLSV